MRALLPISFVLLASLATAAEPGPAVGSKVPDFSLMDQNGETQTAARLMGTNGLMLVFFRSADW